MRWSGLLWWVGAFVSAVMVGFLTYGLMKPIKAAQADVGEEQPTQPIVVAAADIPFRRSISAAELVIRKLPADSVPQGAATSLDQVVGKMATVDLFANSPILVQQLVTPDIVTQQLALSVPRGKIVLALPTQSKLISNRLIRPGDHIDLLATVELGKNQQGNGPTPESIAVLQNQEVHAIILAQPPLKGEAPKTEAESGVFQTSEEGGQSVLLAVTTQDALTVRHVLDVGGIIDVALRAPDDKTVQDAIPVDQFYLTNRYKINLSR